jgi:hypothetical protein
MLPLTFSSPTDYDRVREDDRISITGLAEFAPGRPLTMILQHADGSTEEFPVNHTFNQNQIGWFKAGSALNLIAAQVKAASTPKVRPRVAKPPVRKKTGKAAKKPGRKKTAGGRVGTGRPTRKPAARKVRARRGPAPRKVRKGNRKGR